MAVTPRIGFWLMAVPLMAQNWQRVADRAMAGRQGTAVVLDVASGKLLGAHRLDYAARHAARPGSTIKPFTLLTLLNEGKVTPGTALVCTRGVSIGGRRIDCTHPPTPLPLDATAALAYSCNYFFATLAAGLRDGDLAATYQRAGLAELTGLAHPETAGVVRLAFGIEERQLQALGEGSVEVTPLGLAAVYRKLAHRRNLKTAFDAGLETIYEGLTAATSYGTARHAQPRGITVAGKTGTTSTHAWFAGFAPAATPRIAVVVLVESGAGGADAAPVAREIFQAIIAP
jgi:penicillin-binding protein 2